MACNFLWEHDGLVRRYTGTLTSSDIVASARRTETHSNFSALRWMISDMTSVTDVDVSDDAFETFLMHAIGASYTNNRIRIAFVCTNIDAMALVQKFMTMQDCYETRMFSKFGPAMTWARRLDT